MHWSERPSCGTSSNRPCGFGCSRLSARRPPRRTRSSSASAAFGWRSRADRISSSRDPCSIGGLNSRRGRGQSMRRACWRSSLEHSTLLARSATFTQLNRNSSRHGSQGDSMLPGIRGSLVASSFLEDVLLQQFQSTSSDDQKSHRLLVRWWRRVDASLGPASSPRAVLDLEPCPSSVAGPRRPASRTARNGLRRHGRHGSRALAVLRTTGFGQDPEHAWRDTVRAGRTSRRALGTDLHRSHIATHGCSTHVVSSRRSTSTSRSSLWLTARGSSSVLLTIARRSALEPGLTTPCSRAMPCGDSDSACRHRLRIRLATASSTRSTRW